MADNKHWDRDTAINQIEKCAFQCEGGPLVKNSGWQWLKKALQIGPKYLPGQGVFMTVSEKKAGIEMSARGHFFVVGVRMDSDTEHRYWIYDLSNDPPAPWRYGQVQFRNVREEELSIIEGSPP